MHRIDRIVAKSPVHFEQFALDWCREDTTNTPSLLPPPLPRCCMLPRRLEGGGRCAAVGERQVLIASPGAVSTSRVAPERLGGAVECRSLRHSGDPEGQIELREFLRMLRETSRARLFPIASQRVRTASSICSEEPRGALPRHFSDLPLHRPTRRVPLLRKPRARERDPQLQER
jgi:hypothetical protein